MDNQATGNWLPLKIRPYTILPLYHIYKASQAFISFPAFLTCLVNDSGDWAFKVQHLIEL